MQMNSPTSCKGAESSLAALLSPRVTAQTGARSGGAWKLYPRSRTLMERSVPTRIRPRERGMDYSWRGMAGPGRAGQGKAGLLKHSGVAGQGKAGFFN